MKKRLETDEITGQVVDAAFKLHTRLGPGLLVLESVYELVLARELERRGLIVERQKPVSFDFDGLGSHAEPRRARRGDYEKEAGD